MSDLATRMEEKGFSRYDFRNDSMEPDDAYRLGRSFADFYGNEGKIFVGRDIREMSNSLKNAVMEGLDDGNCDPEYIGHAPTDMVAFLAAEEGDGGVTVTASHLPPDYRGIKPLTSEGRIFNNDEYNQVLDTFEERVWAPSEFKEWKAPDYGAKHGKYIEALQDRYDELFDRDMSDLTVAIDPGNSIGTYLMPIALEQIGVERENIYSVNHELDPEFPGRGPNPTDEALDDLAWKVLEENADIGIALDGDADRAVFVNEKGEKVSGDESLAILSEKYLDATEVDTPEIACSSNISTLVEEWINDNYGVVDYQPVGAIFTAEAAEKDDNVVFGGQPNGHYLDPGFVPYDSGILSGLVMSGIAAKNNLSEVQSELPNYQIIERDLEVKDKEKFMDDVKQFYEGKRQFLGDNERIDLGYPKIIMRSSGSEPVVRAKLEIKEPEDILDSEIQNISDRRRPND